MPRKAAPSAKTPAKRPQGRPATGLKPGEKSQDYPRLNVRVPPRLKARVDAATHTLQTPAWLLVIDALEAYLDRKGC